LISTSDAFWNVPDSAVCILHYEEYLYVWYGGKMIENTHDTLLRNNMFVEVLFLGVLVIPTVIVCNGCM